MYILSVSVREFGGLRDLSLDFSEGLNLVTGNNESGKSTLIAFIRFMLYGLPKRQAGEMLSDGERAFSWENGVADGSMTVKNGGSVYRIERRETSGSTRKLLQIIDESTGEALPKGVNPGELFLGIPREVFDSTACIRQLRSKELDGDGLTGAIENLLLSGDDKINTEKVLKNLDKARTVLLHKNGHGGEIHRADAEITALRLRLDRLKADIAELRAAEQAEETLKERLAHAERALKSAEEDCARLSGAETLLRFDALHAEEERLTRERAAFEALTAAHTYNGFLPNDTYIRTLDSHAQQLDADERSILRCDAERRISAEIPKGDEALIGTADAVENAGGAEAVAARLDANAREIGRAKRLPRIFFPVGGALLLLGIVLGAVSGDPLCYCISLGGLLALVGLVGLRAEKRAKDARDAFLHALGLPKDQTQSELASRIDRAEREREREAARVVRVGRAEETYTEASAAAATHLREAKDIAYRVLPYGSAVNASVLRDLSGRLSLEEKERERASHSLAVYEESCRRTKEALSAYDENELRRRLPVGSDYKNAESAARYEEKRNRAKETLSSLMSERLSLEGRLSALRATVGSPEEILEELSEKQAEKERLEKKHRAILLAYESISAARDGLKHRIGPRLRADASRYLSGISSGKYDAMSYSTGFALSTEENGRLHPSDAFSGGTQDAMYLSLRLALTGLLAGEKEPLPLLLDEALAQLDDTRAEALLSILSARAEKDKGQAIFFTCHTRESRMLAGTSARMITLE